MEWWKLFSGTFILIFLAELGDKTQLAAMAKTADSPGSSTAKWVVFFGASLALVASTFIAVFLGHLLKSVVPDERYIKIAAGTLFLLFGGKILYDVYASYRHAPVAAATSASVRLTPVERGLVGGLALRAAMDFESHAGERYRRLAASAPPRLAEVLKTLASEEDSHLARLRNMPAAPSGTAPFDDRSVADVGAERDVTDVKSPDTVAELIRHEEATADFYLSLAERAIIPSVKGVLLELAEEERSHASRLREARDTLL